MRALAAQYRSLRVFIVFSLSLSLSPGKLCEMGFPREMVLEAFMACDKNEEMAANFLFDS